MSKSSDSTPTKNNPLPGDPNVSGTPSKSNSNSQDKNVIYPDFQKKNPGGAPSAPTKNRDGSESIIDETDHPGPERSQAV